MATKYYSLNYFRLYDPSGEGGAAEPGGNEVSVFPLTFTFDTSRSKLEVRLDEVVLAEGYTYDPETKAGSGFTGRKVKGTIHWLNAADARPAEIRLYDRLFTVEQPGVGDVDFLTQLNPDSFKTVRGFVEPALTRLAPGDVVQFERTGYFAVDPDSTAELPVFNRTVTLRDSWSKQQKK